MNTEFAEFLRGIHPGLILFMKNPDSGEFREDFFPSPEIGHNPEPVDLRKERIRCMRDYLQRGNRVAISRNTGTCLYASFTTPEQRP